MFSELDRYKHTGHFFFTGKEDLEKVCNAPKNCSGVYLIYELKDGHIDLVYIGSSGKVRNDGTIKHDQDGLYGSIVNNRYSGKSPAKTAWKRKLKDENIDAWDVYWFDTFDGKNRDIPTMVQTVVMQIFLNLHGSLPRWNEEI